MSVVCVNLNSPEVKNLAGELGIHPSSLEECIHGYWNSPYGQRYFAAHGDYPFPSTDYVKEYFFGGNTNTGELAIKAWARTAGSHHYGELYNSSIEYIEKDIAAYEPIVGHSAIHIYRGIDGSRVFKVARPKLANEEELKLLLTELRLIHKWGSKKYRLTYNGRLSDRVVIDSFNSALDVLNINRDWFTLRKQGKTIVVEFRPGFSESNNINYDNSDLLFQKSNLIDQINILRSYQLPLSGRGSIKNAIQYIKGLKNVDTIIKGALVKALQTDPSLLKLSVYDLWNNIMKQREVGLAKEYNEYIEQPINEALEKHLAEYLEPYHISVQESGIAEQYGATGVFDILNKVIHLAKNRNSITMTEEFAHAFVELMGSVSSTREENKDYTFLMEHVVETDLYKQVYDQYSTIYVDKNGQPDIEKIKKEAVGQALAVAINNKWNNKVSEADTTFWQKLKEWFNKILDMFRNSEYINFESLTNKIATEVINKDYSRLAKVDASNYSVLNYSETLAKQNIKDGGKALDMMRFFSDMGNVITGSLSYRKLGTVYRGSADALHDIDMKVPQSAHGIDLQDSIIKGILSRAKRNSDELIPLLLKTPYFTKVMEKYPKMKMFTAYGSEDSDTITISGVYSEDESLSERFAAMKGSYASRLESFTEEERDQMYLFDFFLEAEDRDYIVDDETGLKLSKYEDSFSQKLKMGRAKDIFDYQMYNTFEEYKNQRVSPEEFLMLQTSPIPFNTLQKKAISGILDYLTDKDNQDKDFCVIEGVAGSGKTTIVNEILKRLEDECSSKGVAFPHVAVGAVANKAVKVISSKIESPIKRGSCASILGLRERRMWNPISQTMVEKWVRPKQKRGEAPLIFGLKFTDTDILIVDECSMLNEEQLSFFLLAKELYDRKHKKEGKTLKIVFIGDPRQAPSIRDTTKAKINVDAPSPTFTHKNVGKFILTDRVRQGNASPVPTFSDIPGNWSIQDKLEEMLQKDRRKFTKEATEMFGKIRRTSSIISEGGALCIYNDTSKGCSQKVIDIAVPMYRLMIIDGNVNLGKIVCAHVAAVSQYNDLIQKRLHPEDKEVRIHEGDPLMFYSPYFVGEGEAAVCLYHNSDEILATGISDVLEDTFDIIHSFLSSTYSDYKKIPPIKYLTTVVNTFEGSFVVKLLVPSIENIKNYENFLRVLAEKATLEFDRIQHGDRSRESIAKALVTYEKEVSKIAHNYFGYAISAHKSLGSTYDTVIVDYADIKGLRMPNGAGGTIGGFSLIAQAKLFYTGITRASNVTVLVGDFLDPKSPLEDIVTLNNRINLFKGKKVSSPTTQRLASSIPSSPTEINTGGSTSKMAKAEKMWKEILDDLDAHNEKVDTPTEHAYYFYPDGKDHPETRVQIATSVTSVVNPVRSLNAWLEVASRLGTATDNILRDYFDGIDITTRVYPNYNSKQLAEMKQGLQRLSAEFDKKFAGKAYKVISSEHPLIAKYIDEKGEVKTVGGTIDLLIIDEDGNYYIYDVKTSRSSIRSDEKKQHHYGSLVNFYREILEATYPQLKGRCKGLGLVELTPKYPAPKGERDKGGVKGNANYTFDGALIKLEGMDILSYKGIHQYKAPVVAADPLIPINSRTPDRVVAVNSDRTEQYAPITVKPYSEPKQVQAPLTYEERLEAMESSDDYEDEEDFDLFGEAPISPSAQTITPTVPVTAAPVAAPSVVGSSLSEMKEDPSLILNPSAYDEDEDEDIDLEEDFSSETKREESDLQKKQGIEERKLASALSAAALPLPSIEDKRKSIAQGIVDFKETYRINREAFDKETDSFSSNMSTLELLTQLTTILDRLNGRLNKLRSTQKSLSTDNPVSHLSDYKYDAIDLADDASTAKKMIAEAKNRNLLVPDFVEPNLELGETKNQPSPVQSVPQSDASKIINIWAGSNENADLSNFAERPFVLQHGTIYLADGTTDSGTIRFQSVELAFLYLKLSYSSMDRTKKWQIANLILSADSPQKAKNFGGKFWIKDLNVELWDKEAAQNMKSLIKESFKQNPKALERLLATGNATLTHTQEKGKWGTEFPRILMEVREELRLLMQTSLPLLQLVLPLTSTGTQTNVSGLPNSGGENSSANKLLKLALDSRYEIVNPDTTVFRHIVKALKEAKSCEVTVANKKSRDGKTSNVTLILSIPGHPEKGWFEIVADRTKNGEEYGGYNGEYSLHFKTKSSKANNDSKTATEPLTNTEKEHLFNVMLWAIPQGSRAISTWGELSKGGVAALNSLAERSKGQLFKVGERTLKDIDGTEIKVPVYAKLMAPIAPYGDLPAIMYPKGKDEKGRLAFSNLTPKRDGTFTYSITVFSDGITVDSFFDYVKGNIESPSSKQKKEVFSRLEKMGYTEDYLRAMLGNKKEVIAFLIFHEKSHILHNDFKGYYDSDPQRTLMLENQLEIETRATVDAIREFEAWKQTERGQNTNPVSAVTTTLYTDTTPTDNESTAFMFGENAQFAMTANNQTLPDGMPTIERRSRLHVESGNSGTNQAVIRADKTGTPYPNSCGIVVKKWALQLDGTTWVMLPGNFQDTEEDFELFKTLNYQAFAKARRFGKVVFPAELGMNKAAMPARFAEWLLKELYTKFGVKSTVQRNTKHRLDGYGLILEAEKQAETPKAPDLIIAPKVEGYNASLNCAAHAAAILGVSTLRGAGSAHFGNPFSVKSYPGVIDASFPSVDAAVKAFELWLRGTAYKNVEPARRLWILNQINSGNLDGKPLVYYTTTVDSQPGKDYFGNDSSDPGTYDYVSRPNHAHILLKLIMEHLQGKVIGQGTVQGAVPSNNPMTPSSFTNYSGGAYGGDTIWDTVGRSKGFTGHVHYAAEDGRVGSSLLRNSGVKGVTLTREQYDEAAAYLNKEFRRGIKPLKIVNPETNTEVIDYSFEDKLTLRDYFQAKNADAVYALAPIRNGIVVGGTATAVFCAIRMNKPVYVWDTNTKTWHTFDAAHRKYVPCGTPILTTRYAGVGTRLLSNYRTYDKKSRQWKYTKELGLYLGEEMEAAARLAVLDVFEKTLNQPKLIVEKYGEKEVQRTLDILKSDDSVLGAEEKKEAEKILGPTRKIKMVFASERSDPALHAEDVKALIQPEIDKKHQLARLKEALKIAATEAQKEEIKKQMELIGEPKFNAMYLITKHDGLPLRELASLDIPKFIHFSITGLGNTAWEPGVMKADDMLDRIEELLLLGVLNPRTTYIRIDPIIPGATDPAMVEHIILRSRAMGLRTPIRFSIMDSYGYTEDSNNGHVRNRHIIETVTRRIPDYDWEQYYGYIKSGVNKGKVEYHAKPEVRKYWFDTMQALGEKYDVKFELCAEAIPEGNYSRMMKGKSCVNPEVVNAAMGTNDVALDKGEHNRPGCGCGAGVDALSTTTECKSSCTYCFLAHNLDPSLNYYDSKGNLRTDDEYNRLTLVTPQTKSLEEVDKEEDALTQLQIFRALQEVLAALNLPTIQKPINPRDIYSTSELELIKARKALAEATATIIKPTELRNLAKVCMFELSDAITLLVSTDDYADEFFPDDPLYAQWRGKSFKGYERIDLIKEVGLNVLLDVIKEKYFTVKSLKERGGKATLGVSKKFAIIRDNWSAFTEMAYSSLAELESVAVTNMTLDRVATKALKTLNNGEEEVFEGLSALEIAEMLGSSLEHWQIGFRLLSAFSSLSKMLKLYVNSIHEVDKDGNYIRDNTYKMPIRVDAGKAVANILRWTLGATTLEEMISAIESQAAEHPWVKKLVEDLKGDDYTFQSLFFSNFKKYFLPYLIQYIDKKTGRLTMKVINAGSLEKEMAREWADTWKGRVDENKVNVWESTQTRPMALYTRLGLLDTVLIGTEKDPAEGTLMWARQTLKPFAALIREHKFNPTQEDREKIKKAIKTIYKAFDVNLKDDADAALLESLLSKENISDIYKASYYLIGDLLKKAASREMDYNPYTVTGKGSHRSNIELLFSKVVDYSEQNLESVSYENGKMHYSYVIPSYLSKLMGKIQGQTSGFEKVGWEADDETDSMDITEKSYRRFLQEEYGKYPWYKKNGRWRNEWLRVLASDKKARAQFLHAVLLSQETKKGTKLGYTDKSPVSYERSMLANYFYADKYEEEVEEVAMTEEEINKAYNNLLRIEAEKLKESAHRPETVEELMGKLHNSYTQGAPMPFTLPLTKKITKRTLKSSEYGYFHIPMMSNKPSEEYIHFIKYGTSNPNWKRTLIENLEEVADLEIDRIATAEMRATDSDTAAIKNFDHDRKKGKKGNAEKFVFLEYLQPYLEEYDNWAAALTKVGGSTSFDTVINLGRDKLTLGKLLREKIEAAKTGRVLLSSMESKYNELMLGTSENPGAIERGMSARYQEYLDFLRLEGMIIQRNNKEDFSNFKGLNMGNSQEEILANLENFFWNDAFASINILQLTVTDIAFYKDTEDLQKRLAQIHAPGLRANILAKDSHGNYVALGANGKALERTIYLTDLDGIVSDAIENVRGILMDRYNSMPTSTPEEQKAKEEYLEVVESLVDSFKNINVADAQGYSSLTSYRKKAILFGKWGDDYEKMWLDFLNGGYKDARLLKIAIQPLKPFIYSQTAKASVGPLSLIKEGVQNKNSEYLLMMMDAILMGEGKSGSCMLRAINEIMEETHLVTKLGDHYVAGTGGIDTVQFESTVKAGLQGKIDISPAAIRVWLSNPENVSKWEKNHLDWIKSSEGKKWREKHPERPISDTEVAKLIIRDAIYVNGDRTLGYNPKSVHELDYEDYCLQSEVPAHLEGDSIFGSQLRILGISDTPETDALGNPNYIKIGNKTMTVKEAKIQYMQAIRLNIMHSMETLKKELALDNPNTSLAERNKKLSDLLVKQIREDNKDGIDLLYAVTTDELGNFMLPLSDPVMATRILQLLNSIIKSRINKQLMKGGPVVLVTNFGTGKSLQIVFLDSEGNELDTFQKFFERAIEEDIERVKKGEKPLFPHLVTEKTVSMNTSEMGLVGKFWDKFKKAMGDAKKANTKSVTVPKFTWDEFVQLSKFEEKLKDAEKTYGKGSEQYKAIFEKAKDYRLAYKALLTAYLEYLKDKKASIKHFECYAPSKVFAEEFPEALDKNGNVNIEWFKKNGREDVLNMIGYRIPTESKYSMAPLKIVGFLPYEAGEGIMLPKDITLLSGSDFDIDKMYIVRLEIDKIFDREAAHSDYEKETKISFDKKKTWDAIYEEYSELDGYVELAQKEWYEEYKKQGGDKSFEDAIDDSKLTGKHTKTDWLDKDTKNEYWEKFFSANPKGDFIENKGKRISWEEWWNRNKGKYFKGYERPASMENTHGRNNIIFDTLWGSLTSPLSATQIFTPGNFDLPKKYGYMAAVLQMYPSMTYDEVNSLSVDDLKKKLASSKNLVYNHTHLLFHKQNMVAGKLIGVFAQNNVSHSVISLMETIIKEEDGTLTEVYPKMILLGDDMIQIEGETLLGEVEYDRMYNKYGERISSTLAAFLAASVDAVKDPVLNYMNVNEVTAGVLTTLVRLGYDTELAMMLLTRPVIMDLVQRYIVLNETNTVSMDDVAALIIKENGGHDPNTPSISKEYLKELIDKDREGQDEYDNCNLVTAFMRLYSISRSTSNIVALTKFNSVTAAIGPLITDTLAMQMKVEDALTDPRLLDISMQEAINNEIPLAFREATLGKATRAGQDLVIFSEGLGLDLFEGKFITASQDFRDAVIALLAYTRGSLASESKRNLLNRFSDFYIAFVLNSNLEMDARDALFQTEANPNPLSKERRAELLRGLPNRVEEVKKTTSNSFLKAIQVKAADDSHVFKWLNINSRSFTGDLLDDIKASWYELYLGTEEEQQLAMDLVEYNYLIDCFGFNPMTFSKLIPILLRNKIPNYTTKLRLVTAGNHRVNHTALIELFIRNNHNMKELVFTVTEGTYSQSSNGQIKIDTNLCPYIISANGRPRLFAKLPDGRLLKVTLSDSGNLNSAPKRVGDNIFYLEISTLGGEGNELIEFNPNGPVESIFTDLEMKTLRDHYTGASTASTRRVTYTTAHLLLYFLLTHIDEGMRNAQIEKLQTALKTNDDALIQKALAEVLASGQCGNIDNFTSNMADTKQALFQVVAYFTSKANERDAENIKKLINGIQTTQQQLKICK